MKQISVPTNTRTKASSAQSHSRRKSSIFNLIRCSALHDLNEESTCTILNITAANFCFPFPGLSEQNSKEVIVSDYVLRAMHDKIGLPMKTWLND